METCGEEFELQIGYRSGLAVIWKVIMKGLIYSGGDVPLKVVRLAG